ncbi:uncharacterized protein IUM83_17535 [Phytophthora cinnamomi]|uniref:uncharacterized protein n=1 Tax=Phytophthora cinnamomi TaxID=4785 RepID=UPI00355A6CDC|nr:hypothetical protein IUM83_17535 [Phytophthora cinnamomi]
MRHGHRASSVSALAAPVSLGFPLVCRASCTPPSSSQLRGSVTFRTGQRSSGPRKGIVKSFKFVADAGYSVDRAQMFRFLSARRVAEGIRRATADRVRAAAAEIVVLQEREGRRLDPIATHHLAVHHARQPEGAPLTVPSDNTMRQVLALDAAAEAVQGGVDEHEEDAVEIEVELFGAWVKIRVKRSSLRAALRLPQHDIFSRGIFHGFQPEMMMPQGSDIPDLDYNAPMEME